MLERLYTIFARYRLPADLEVCEQCKPVILEWLRQPIIGTRLWDANCTAAHDLWAVQTGG